MKLITLLSKHPFFYILPPHILLSCYRLIAASVAKKDILSIPVRYVHAAAYSFLELISGIVMVISGVIIHT